MPVWIYWQGRAVSPLGITQTTPLVPLTCARDQRRGPVASPHASVIPWEGLFPERLLPLDLALQDPGAERAGQSGQKQ